MTVETPNILLIADDAPLEQRMRTLFPAADVEVAHQWNEPEEGSDPYDVVVLSNDVCARRGISPQHLMEGLSSMSRSTQCIYLTDTDGVGQAMSALDPGAFQQARTPISDKELQQLIERALSRTPVTRKPRTGRPNRFHRLVGRSRPMRQVYRQLEQAGRTDVVVLLLGETGTGKDLAAQAIHSESDREDAPFIAVNLGALPREIVASELFGHDRGAFTGAVRDHHGKLEQAAHGTLFLDEINAIDEAMQISLLRVIEQKTFHRLGGEQSVKTNARLIFASNQNLGQLVREGTFREDLFYRLDVFRIMMPPLRERRGDIPLLSNEFLSRFNTMFKKDIRSFSDGCMKSFEAYNWPGNVRELKNIIQRAMLVCDGGEIRPEHLPAKFHGGPHTNAVLSFEVGTPLEQVEREMICRALLVSGNNRTETARLLGISRRSLYSRLRKHAIE